MFESEAYMEAKNIIRWLYKTGEWHSLDPKIRKVYKDDLDYWRLRLGRPDDIENQDNKLGVNNSGQAKKPRRKKYYEHPLSIEQAEDKGMIPADPFSLEEYIMQQETYQELHMAIEMLDDTDKSIIEMYYFEEMKERQIGQELAIVQKTVNNHKRDSLKEMKKKLEKMQ